MKAVEIQIDGETKIFELKEHTFKTGNTGFIGQGTMYAKDQGYVVLVRLAKFKQKEKGDGGDKA